MEGAGDTDLLRAKVDGHRVVLRDNDATEAVPVVGDAVLHGEPLDRSLGWDCKGTAGKLSPLCSGSSVHPFQYAPSRTRSEPP
jgi:hypothetical protein